MNNYGVPVGTDLKPFSSENTTIIHYSSAKRLHYSSFITALLHMQQGPFSFDLIQQLFHQGGIGPVVQLSVEADVGPLAAHTHAGHQPHLQLAPRPVEKMR